MKIDIEDIKKFAAGKIARFKQRERHNLDRLEAIIQQIETADSEAEESGLVAEFNRLVAELRQRMPVVIYGDDFDKFGGWGGTYEKCYGEGWLEAFVRLADPQDHERLIQTELITKFLSKISTLR